MVSQEFFRFRWVFPYEGRRPCSKLPGAEYRARELNFAVAMASPLPNLLPSLVYLSVPLISSMASSELPRRSSSFSFSAALSKTNSPELSSFLLSNSTSSLARAMHIGLVSRSYFSRTETVPLPRELQFFVLLFVSLLTKNEDDDADPSERKDGES